jgi:hypothetical protein
MIEILAPLNSEPRPSLQDIEVATFFQLPSFHIIGLPGQEVGEARERVRAAIEASGLEFPKRRVVLNLSPASIRKRGTGLDLAMALAVLAIGSEQEFRLGAWGELGLDGAVKPVGQLTRSIYAIWCAGVRILLLSRCEIHEAHQALATIRESREFSSLLPALVPVDSLTEAWNLIESGEEAMLKVAQEAAILSNLKSRPENKKLGSVPLVFYFLCHPRLRGCSGLLLQEIIICFF